MVAADNVTLFTRCFAVSAKKEKRGAEPAAYEQEKHKRETLDRAVKMLGL